MNETPLQVLNEPDRPATTKSYMWLMVGSQEDGCCVVLYNYSPHRSARIVESLLEGYSGVLQTDAYSGYSSVGVWDGIWHAGCMRHSRRKFFEAHVGAGGKGHAKIGIKYIKSLYRIERDLRAAQLTNREFVLARRTAAAAVFREFKKWLKVLSKTVPPKSLLGKAVSYTLSEFQRLVRYLKYFYRGI